MNDTCICCGEPIPEGRQVCISCEKASSSGSVIVGWDFSNEEDYDFLIVWKRVNGQMKIINTYQGKAATEIHKTLIKKRV